LLESYAEAQAAGADKLRDEIIAEFDSDTAAPMLIASHHRTVQPNRVGRAILRAIAHRAGTGHRVG
jgi:hypothetical protein